MMETGSRGAEGSVGAVGERGAEMVDSAGLSGRSIPGTPGRGNETDSIDVRVESSLFRLKCGMVGRTSSKSMSWTCIVSFSLSVEKLGDSYLSPERRRLGNDSLLRRDDWRPGAGEVICERPLTIDAESLSVDGLAREARESRVGFLECLSTVVVGDKGGSLPSLLVDAVLLARRGVGLDEEATLLIEARSPRLGMDDFGNRLARFVEIVDAGRVIEC